PPGQRDHDRASRPRLRPRRDQPARPHPPRGRSEEEARPRGGRDREGLAHRGGAAQGAPSGPARRRSLPGLEGSVVAHRAASGRDREQGRRHHPRCGQARGSPRDPARPQPGPRPGAQGMSPWKRTPRPVAALALGLLLWSSPSGAAEVAVLKSTDAPAWRPAVEAFKRGLPGHTITEYDLRGDRNEAERVIGALKGKGALLVAFGPLAAEAARETASDQMLVFCMVQDPAKAGLLNNINASGVAFATPIKNQLAAFRLVYPRAVRIGVVHGPEEAVAKLVQEAQKAAGVVRLVVTARMAATERDVPQALRSLLRGEEAVDAIWLPPDPLLVGEATRRFLLAETLKA